jgi:hypothetical protein
MSELIFFNHYHRGDLHTHKEFIKHLQQELPDFKFEYLHKNPESLTLEYGINKLGVPDHLDNKTPFYKDDTTLYINTWVGCWWDIFCKHGGINMHTLYEQWQNIFDMINSFFNKNIDLKKDKELYLPKIDYSKLYVDGIVKYLDSSDKKRILICNNIPSSNQSFVSDMKDYIEPLANKYLDRDIICTNKFNTNLDNIKFTSDIIKTDRDCDLQEISFLSRHCDYIIGKNSGPYVFCETYDNYMDERKTFISFNLKNPQFADIKETMSNGLVYKCNYINVPIINPNPTSEDRSNISKVFEKIL